MAQEEFLKEIKDVKEKSKKRSFTQTWDLVINLKDVDLKKPENRFNLDFSLPEGRGKEIKALFIVDTLLPKAKEAGAETIQKSEIEKLGKDKKKLKKYADEYDFWFCEAPLMPLVGKTLGTVLGPRGKMPKPVPPRGEVKPFIEMAKRLVKVRVKDSPVIHVPVGSENMKDDQVMKNLISLLNFVKGRLPKKEGNIKDAYIKLTMGPPIKIKV